MDKGFAALARPGQCPLVPSLSCANVARAPSDAPGGAGGCRPGSGLPGRRDGYRPNGAQSRRSAWRSKTPANHSWVTSETMVIARLGRLGTAEDVSDPELPRVVRAGERDDRAAPVLAIRATTALA